MKSRGTFNSKYVALAVALIFLAFFVNASANYLSNNLQSNYSAGETIKGKFNLNLANHPSDALLTSNFDGNITLLDFITAQTVAVEGINYNCSTQGCTADYASVGSINQLQLASGQDRFAGFGLDGPGISITNVELIVNSNAPASCSPNLYVDLLADDLDVVTSNKGSGQSCGIRHIGCYNPLNALETKIVTGKEYCEKIKLPAAPSLILGGTIKKGNGESNLTMKIYDSDTSNLLGSCRLPQNTENTQALSCEVNHSSSESKDYYVCITTSMNNDYSIGAETSAPTCGTAQGFNSLNSDFDLFAETITYAALPSVVINQSTYLKFSGQNLAQVIENYVQNKYSSNCQPNTCLIPIRLFGTDQTVDLDSEINYESVGLTRNTQQTYGLNYDSAKITAHNISLDISKANFAIPIESTENKFKLYLDGGLLFEKPISIKKSFSFDVNPKIVPFGQNTKFTATSTSNITKTIWNFGDGSATQTVDGSSVFHAFIKPNSSSFDINVTAIINQTQTTRQFRIFVGNPKDIANSTIIEYKGRILNITRKIDLYPIWSAQKIKNTIDLGNLTSKLKAIESFYNNASTESDYQKTMLDLISLNMPYDVSTTFSGDNLALDVGQENINVNYAEEISNKDFDDLALKGAVVGWMNSNFNSDISFKKIERISDSEKEPIMTVFTIRTNPIGVVSAKTYLILGQDISNAGLYKSNYNHLTLPSGADYIVLDTSSSQTFEFLIEGDIDAETLGAYIAPSLAELGDIQAPTATCNLNNICDNDENAATCPEDCSKRWFKFTLVGWIILIFIALAMYIFLQEWYKRHYQKSLFPESNELYNLVNFIYNARKSGLSDSEIRAKLREQNWSNEKIRFAFNKLEGKSTGMFEIPLFRWRENKEVAKQIARRQPQGAINARFIKRHSY